MSQPARRPTLKDVAAKAGLSVMVASYTFSSPDRVSAASRARIQAAAAELGYRPHRAARTLRTGNSGLIGVVVSEHLSYAFRDPGATQFLAGVAEVCAAAGKGMVLLPTSAHLDPAATITAADIDGYVFWTTAPDDPTLAEAVTTGLPIAIQGGPAIEGTTCISIDDRAAARAVSAEALHGAERPAVIAFPTDPARQPATASLTAITAVLPVTQARLDGIRASLKDAHLDPAQTPCLILSENNRTRAQGAAKELMEQHPATDAIICMSDEIALGALTYLNQQAFDIPEKVSLTGFDAIPEALDRGITTIKQDLHEQGRLAAGIALGDTPGNASLTWELHISGTTRQRRL
ncbi:MAG: LacI family DNA-binding transcriptional regulator [Nocardioides sp.]|uniref:LacI family DNA-binding transcriptional regulator n=1 Tax=Nocardioides sp. TaxID=35761 RepID=UPI0039E649A7